MNTDFSVKHVLETADELAVSMHDVDWDTRLKAFHRIKAEFCDQCGEEQPQTGPKCQCSNDE